MLTFEEIVSATEIPIKTKVDFIKTSTGFNGGEQLEKLLKQCCIGKRKNKSERLGCNYAPTSTIVDRQEGQVKNRP